MMDLLRLLLVLLLALPAAGALVVALCGPSRPQLVRQISLTVTLLDLLLAIVVTFGFLSAREERPLPNKAPTFQPVLVPGADAKVPEKTTWNLIELGPSADPRSEVRPIQFYIGLDGLNV